MPLARARSFLRNLRCSRMFWRTIARSSLARFCFWSRSVFSFVGRLCCSPNKRRGGALLKQCFGVCEGLSRPGDQFGFPCCYARMAGEHGGSRKQGRSSSQPTIASVAGLRARGHHDGHRRPLHAHQGRDRLGPRPVRWHFDAIDLGLSAGLRPGHQPRRCVVSETASLTDLDEGCRHFADPPEAGVPRSLLLRHSCRSNKRQAVTTGSKAPADALRPIKNHVCISPFPLISIGPRLSKLKSSFRPSYALSVT